jgi:hypothetical protein
MSVCGSSRLSWSEMAVVDRVLDELFHVVYGGAVFGIFALTISVGAVASGHWAAATTISAGRRPGPWSSYWRFATGSWSVKRARCS